MPPLSLNSDTLECIPKEEEPSGSVGSWYSEPSHAAFEVVSCFCIDTAGRSLLDVGQRLVPLRNFLATQPEDEFLVTNRVCPLDNGLSRNVVVVSRRTLQEGEDAVFDRLWARYKRGDAAFRDQQLRYLPRIKSAAPCERGALAPWLLHKAIYLIGGQEPVKMGTGYLRQHHSTGPNYVEVDVDIRSSSVARNITASILAFCSSLELEEAFALAPLPVAAAQHGDGEARRRERVLFQVQYKQVDTDLITQVLREDDYLDEDDATEQRTSHASLFFQAQRRGTHVPVGEKRAVLLGLCICLAFVVRSPWFAALALFVLHPAPPALDELVALIARLHPRTLGCFAALGTACVGAHFMGCGMTTEQTQWLGAGLLCLLLYMKSYGAAEPGPGREDGQGALLMAPSGEQQRGLNQEQLRRVLAGRRGRSSTSQDDRHIAATQHCAICLAPFTQDGNKQHQRKSSFVEKKVLPLQQCGGQGKRQKKKKEEPLVEEEDDEEEELRREVTILDACGHTFHTDCLERWLTRKSTCPMCRRELRVVT